MKRILLVALALVLAFEAFGDVLENLIDFSPETIALSADVNSNFADTETEVTENSGRIDTNITAIGVNSAARHAEAHTAASHSDQGATGAELETLTDASDADALHTHSHTPDAVSILEAMLIESATPTDDYILSFNEATGGFTWVEPLGLTGPVTSVGNTTSIAADAIANLTEIDQDLKSAKDDTSLLVVATAAGTSGDCAQWGDGGILSTTGAACGGGAGTLTGDGTATYIPYYKTGETQVMDSEAAFAYTAGSNSLAVSDIQAATADFSGAVTAASIDTNAPASNSGAITIKEGADKADDNTYTFRGLNAGWSNDIEIVWPDENAPDPAYILGIVDVTAGVIKLNWQEDATTSASIAGVTLTECETLYAPNELISNVDDIESVWRAPAALTITEVWCESDETATTIQLQRDDETPTDMLSQAEPCDGGATSGFVGTENQLAAGDTLDYLTIAIDGTPERLTVCWEYDHDA
jgi:hypothetical protein